MNDLRNEHDGGLYGRILDGAGERQRLAGDASTRIYYRVSVDGKTFIVCRDYLFTEYTGPEYPFITMQRLLNDAEIPVPSIVAMDKGRGLFLLQDLGDELLEYHIRGKDEEHVLPLYRLCIDLLVRLQSIKGRGETPFTLAFDAEKLMYEFNFFIEHTLEGYFRCVMNPGLRAELAGSFRQIAEMLDVPRHFVLNHRDYHARNIMVHRGGLYLIDFQDARMGLPHYDLVSLLEDPYVRLSRSAAAVLKDYYYGRAREQGITAMDRDEFDYFYDVMAFQRLVKAAGSYGYLTASRGKPEFEKYIIPALECAGTFAGKRPELTAAWTLTGELARIDAGRGGRG